MGPTNVRVSEITATSVRLTWSYDGPDDLQYYIIQFKPKYANQAYSEISGIITMYYAVRNLSPYTEYEMYVIANNNIGRGPPSAPAIVTTGETGRICIDVQIVKIYIYLNKKVGHWIIKCCCFVSLDSIFLFLSKLMT